KVKSLVSQLSNGEWLLSLPGAYKSKAFLTMGVGCHTLQRVLTSNHDAAEFQQVFLRMARYSPGSTPTHPQPLLPGPAGERPARGAPSGHGGCRQGGRGISREREPRQFGGDRISAQDAPPPQGPVHQ